MKSFEKKEIWGKSVFLNVECCEAKQSRKKKKKKNKEVVSNLCVLMGKG